MMNNLFTKSYTNGNNYLSAFLATKIILNNNIKINA